MSSMVIRSLLAALLASSAVLSTAPASAQDRSQQSAGMMNYAIGRWEQLAAAPRSSFEDYASFLLAYPGFPDQDKLRGFAEERLNLEFAPPARIVAYFDAMPPLTNPGRAHYALALLSVRPDQAEAAARAAWRGGQMSDNAYATIANTFGGRFTYEDHDARMDALLWQRDAAAAARQIPYVSPDKSAKFAARLAILQGGDGATADPSATTDPGYLYNRARELRTEGRGTEAVLLLAARPPLSAKPFNPTAWIEEHLNVARIATAGSAQQIATRAAEPFTNEADIADGPYKLRDDYTSLMWLGGSRTLWELGDGNAAAPLFYRYGAAARTPQTRSKGFFWAGEAASRAGNPAEANRYWQMAAGYPEYFYGMLAHERLGRALPPLTAAPAPATPEQRVAFLGHPLTQAVQHLSRSSYSWQTKRKFYTALSSNARSEAELALAGQLASELGLPELGVVVGRTAPEKGFTTLTQVGFPTVQTPAGSDWTMVHAIARQESEFDRYRISHAGAQGLMQLMPGTAREQAGKLGVAYMSASLMPDTQYNISLGNAYFQRMLNTYGSYPLAVAAYNAGPGNVNKWLRQNGDPRTGRISWIDWIEQIPFFETKNYVQRVLENAAVYEALHPDLATQRRSRNVGEFLR